MDQKLVLLNLILSGKNIIKYLIAKGLLNSVDVISNGLEIIYFERNNISFGIQTKTKSYFVKQPKVREDLNVFNESKVYEELSSLTLPCDIKNHIPKFVLYDKTKNILITEFLNGNTLNDLHFIKKKSPSYIGKQASSTLHSLHNLNISKLKLPKKEQKPWVLNLISPPIQLLSTESAGTISLFRQVQSDSLLVKILLDFSQNWEYDAICHNDVRLANFFFSPQNSKNKMSKIYLIDWELCGLGWSLWDVACFFESYVQLWIVEASKVNKKKNKLKTISTFHNLIFSFWENYRSKSEGRELNKIDVAISVSKLVGLRLLQSSMEYSQNSNEPTRESILLLESAKRFCQSPLEAWVHILGIPLSKQTGQIKLK